MIGNSSALSYVPSFDFFLDIPHPCASDRSPSNGHVIIGAPPQNFTDSETVCKELTAEKNLGHISRLSFPDFSDKYHASQKIPPPDPASGGLNKFDTYSTGFQTHCFKFTMQSSLGLVVGHTRTYLPTHKNAKGRADVGRRGHRSLVLLTRKTDNDIFCSSILKTAEAMIMQKASSPIPPHPSTSVQIFLHSVLLQQFLQRQQHQPQQQQPITISIPGLEFGQISEYLPFDQYFFMTTQPSINSSSKKSPMLPLLRCLGPNNVVRLLSALMCERRIIFLSKSPTRLSQCVSSAAALLEAGMLSWPHIIIPVLPPHQFPALGTKVKPYIAGVITKCARECRIDLIQGVEDVVLFDLDQQGFVRLLGGGGQNLDRVVPNLLGASLTDGNPNYVPLGQVLAQDLTEIQKQDKFKYTSNLAATVQNIAKKSGETFKNVARSIGRFTSARKNMQNNSATDLTDVAPPSSSEHDDTPIETSTDNILDDGHILMGNELGEDDFNTALVSFFLNLLGGGSWFISNTGSGLIPDVNKFVEERRKRGDIQGTAMYPLIYFFVQTKIFQNFAHERITERKTSMRPNATSPLMLKCTDYISTHQLNYSPFDVRRIVKQMTQNSPKRQQIMHNEAIRRLTLSLTSNRPYEGNAPDDMSKLTKACRMTTTKLVDVMDIIWMRIRNSKSQWKPALLSMYLLKNLILHGPITAISEAMVGLDKIRELKVFQSSNKTNSTQVQVTAKNIYKLLVDRSLLFSLRRAYATRRKTVSNPKPSPFRKVAELKSAPSFRQLHQFLQPKSQVGVVNMKSNDLLGFSNTAPVPPQQSTSAAYATDLLSFDFARNGTETTQNSKEQIRVGVASSIPSDPATNTTTTQTGLGLQGAINGDGSNSLDIFSGLQPASSVPTTPFDSVPKQPIQQQKTASILSNNSLQQVNIQQTYEANPFETTQNSAKAQSLDVFNFENLKQETSNLENPFVAPAANITQTHQVPNPPPNSLPHPVSLPNTMSHPAQSSQYGLNLQQQQVYPQRQVGTNLQHYGQNTQPNYNMTPKLQTNHPASYGQQNRPHAYSQQQNRYAPTQNAYYQSQQHQRDNFQSQKP